MINAVGDALGHLFSRVERVARRPAPAHAGQRDPLSRGVSHAHVHALHNDWIDTADPRLLVPASPAPTGGNVYGKDSPRASLNAVRQR